MPFDLLQRKRTHFVLWRPGGANPPPGLIIGTFLEGNPPSFQPLNTFDLAPSPVSADPWEVAAAACGLANNRVYHYWFEVTNMSPKTPAPARILCADPTAWTVDWRLRAPALVGHSEGRVCAGLCQP
jgi:pullulanase